MLLSDEKVLTVVLGALAVINESKPAHEQFRAEPDTPLIGRGSILTSLELVTLILELETRLYEDYGFQITLADDRAFSQSRSPLRTPSSLAQYIVATAAAMTA